VFTHALIPYFEEWSGGGQLGVRGGSEGARAFDIAGLWLALGADSMTCGRSGNVTAASRLSSMAAPAEALISRVGRCRLQSAGLQTRQLDLKGRTAPITAYVIGRHSARLAA
jgi:hypothetical protein